LVEAFQRSVQSPKVSRDSRCKCIRLAPNVHGRGKSIQFSASGPIFDLKFSLLFVLRVCFRHVRQDIAPGASELPLESAARFVWHTQRSSLACGALIGLDLVLGKLGLL